MTKISTIFSQKLFFYMILIHIPPCEQNSNNYNIFFNFVQTDKKKPQHILPMNNTNTKKTFEGF